VSAEYSQSESPSAGQIRDRSVISSRTSGNNITAPNASADRVAAKPEGPPPSGAFAVHAQHEINQPDNVPNRVPDHEADRSTWLARLSGLAGATSNNITQPAFEFGWQSYLKYGREAVATRVRFDDVEPHLAREWRGTPQSEELPWELAQDAARDAWDRVQQALIGETSSNSNDV